MQEEIEYRFKGVIIRPYEAFYFNTTPQFTRESMRGGVSKCVKTDNSLAILVEDEREQTNKESENDRPQ